MSEANEDILAHQPHDRFFKCLLEEGLIARDLLERYLPSKILPHIDLDKLERVSNEGFLERKVLADVVWQSQIRSNGAPIYVLFEHQSTYDVSMAHRLRQYMWMLSSKLSEKPAIVVALVFYHGRQTNIPDVIDLSGDVIDELSAPGVYGLAAQVPIVNYQQLSWAEIPTNRPASMLECCLKAHLDPQWEILQLAMRNLQCWGELSPKTIAEIRRYVLVQIQVHDSPLHVFHQITQLPSFTPIGDTNMVTLAEWIANTTPEMLEQQWLQAGLQEGLQAGLQEGLQEGLQLGHQKGRQEGLEQGQSLLIQRMFENGMSVDSIASVTGYALEEVQRRLTESSL